MAIHIGYGILKAISNRPPSPLYREAVYGIKNTNIMIDAIILRVLSPNLLPKKSGIVALPSLCVIDLVLLPSNFHARSEPINALPIPIQVDATPNFQPNCPAYPMNMTAEKYDVP